MNIQYPICSGICGSLAGYAGKVAFSSEIHFYDLFYVEKLIGIFLMANLNKLMFQFLFKSFEKNGASLTTLLTFIANNLTNAINGYFFLQEQVSERWVIGMFFLMIGVLFLAEEKEKTKKE